MPIPVICPGYGKELKLPDHLAAKIIRCHPCNLAFPAADAIVARPSPPEGGTPSPPTVAPSGTGGRDV